MHDGLLLRGGVLLEEGGNGGLSDVDELGVHHLAVDLHHGDASRRRLQRL